MLTTEIKLALAALFLVSLAGSYWWVYRQGQLNGAADEVKVQLEIRKANQLEFQQQLQQELHEARQNYDRQIAAQNRKVKAIEDANKILNEQKDALLSALNSPVPDDYIELLNSGRRNFGADPSSAKPSSGADEKVSSPTGLTQGFVAVERLG